MGIIYGLLAALGWGVGDYLSREASRAAGYYRALVYIQAFGILILAGWIAGAPWFGVAVAPPRPGPEVIAGAFGLGVINLGGSLLLLRSFMIGTLAVVAPITAAFAAVSLLLSLLWGDPFGPLQLVGLIGTLVGVIVSSTPSASGAAEVAAGGSAVPALLAEEAARAEVARRIQPPAPLAPAARRPWQRLGVGVPEALGAAVILGAYFWAQRFVVPDLGPYWAAEISTLGTGVVLVLLAWPLRQPLRPPSRAALARILVMTVCYYPASVAFNLGLGSDSPGLVAVVGSLASPVTVLLAFLFLRERLTRVQWAGVGLIFVALVLIAWPAG